MMEDNKGTVTRTLEETSTIEKSPFVAGFLSGLKGALFGAGTAGLVQGIRGKDPVPWAIAGGLGAGLLSGLVSYLKQNYSNVATESDMRYHAMRLKEREPLVFMPPPGHFAGIFSRFHRASHVPPAPPQELR